jgi:integrase/recombinase XerD
MAKRKGRKLPEVLTETEQAALLAQPNPRYPTGQRNRALLQLMLDTGLRVSEACALRWRDIDFTTGQLMVRQGKGAKDRTLWIGDVDLAMLQSWRERQRSDVAGSPEHVFTTLDGNPVSPRYVGAMVHRLTARAGIEKSIHPHTLRHSFATDLYRQTKDLLTTAEALGHASVATTEVYTHLVNDEVRDAMRSFRRPATVAA